MKSTKNSFDDDESILEMIYFKEKFGTKNTILNNHKTIFNDNTNNNNNFKIILLSNKKSANYSKKSTNVFIDNDKITSNRILSNMIVNNSNSFNNTNQQIYELVVDTNKFHVKLKHLLDCIEYINNNTISITLNNENLVSYLNAFTIFGLDNLILNALDKLKSNLTNDCIFQFIKYISVITDQKFIIENCSVFKFNGKYELDELHKYVFWMINYIIIKKFNISVYNSDEIEFTEKNNQLNDDDNKSSKKYRDKIHLDKNFLTNLNFKNNKMILNNCLFLDSKDSIDLDLKFLSYLHADFCKKSSIYHVENNYFNTGKVLRQKSKEGLIHDYPHYFQMILDNDPTLQLFAVRMSENGNFLLSKNINNFNKFSEDYVGEIEANFWGTQFEIYDNGVEKGILENLPKCIFSERKLLGKIIYDTNIMGECPRYFKTELYTNSSDNTPVKHLIKNLDPEWNVKLNCYCLNFYGRVKKASARNFQMVFSDEQEDILLQHGKENSNEFNIDFREPFNYVTSFAHSLVSIGRKRIVS